MKYLFIVYPKGQVPSLMTHDWYECKIDADTFATLRGMMIEKVLSPFA